MNGGRRARPHGFGAKARRRGSGIEIPTGGTRQGRLARQHRLIDTITDEATWRLETMQKDKEVILNTDRMVRSATAGSAGEPYCSLIVDCLWQTRTWLGMTLADIEAFWDEASKSDLTVAEFISLKQKEFA